MVESEARGLRVSSEGAHTLKKVKIKTKQTKNKKIIKKKPEGEAYLANLEATLPDCDRKTKNQSMNKAIPNKRLEPLQK